MDTKKSASQMARESQAEKSFTKSQVQEQRSKDVLAGEAKRVSLTAAKTAKLRALRETMSGATVEEPPAKPSKKAKSAKVGKRASVRGIGT